MRKNRKRGIDFRKVKRSLSVTGKGLRFACEDAQQQNLLTEKQKEWVQKKVSLGQMTRDKAMLKVREGQVA